MSTSGDPVNSTQQGFGGPGGPVYEGQTSFDGMGNNLIDPGQLSVGQLNPYASQMTANDSSLYNMYSGSAAGSAIGNPGAYQGMQSSQMSQIGSGLSSSMNGMGLSGSAGEQGAMGQAVTNNQLAWMQRAPGDMSKAAGGLQGINNQGYGMTMGVQNQYGNFEGAMAQNQLGMLGMEQQQVSGNQQLWGSIIGAGGTAIGGTAGNFGSFGGGGNQDLDYSNDGMNIQGDSGENYGGESYDSSTYA